MIPGAGTILHDRYRLDRELAVGATATVWTGRDLLLDRAVAVKVLHGHLLGRADEAGRFADEARVAATVTHPHLVAVFDAVPGPPPAIVMELVDGPDLRERIALGPLSIAEVLSLGIPIADALDAANRRGLVHRDVKPGNIMITRDGRPKLGDFGIATASAGDRTATGIVLGTAKYLAPEQVRGGPIDARTDVYALCVTLYEAAAGRAPFERDGEIPTAMARLEEEAGLLRTLRPDAPQGLERVIHRGLAREPDARWPSAGAVRDALADEADALGIVLGPINVRTLLGGVSAAPGRADQPAATVPLAGATTRPAPPTTTPATAKAAASTASPRRRRHVVARVLFGLVLAAIATLAWLLITDSAASTLVSGFRAAVEITRG